ncbi:hypothetical protein L7G72_09330 [Xenorhabdus bovienii]|uniref:hypothetical protein n=1 Tax=Xenorhabdus bovienii TaxID=40576 RepID=UPI001EE0FE20|nr:hypothetical protein [Xenorhabdus bovienii]MCG3462049.1 hypothetical protein [Xenorhabdus bovienii]
MRFTSGYIINKIGDRLVLVIDNRDLTPQLETLVFSSANEMVVYFATDQRKPIVLDAVES